MLFILPIGIEESDRPRPRGMFGTPVTWLAVLAIVALFAFEQLALVPSRSGLWLTDATLSLSASWKLYADPTLFKPMQLWTYSLLHDGWWHVIGNLIFFVVFGRALEAWTGSVAYFLALAVLAPASALIFLVEPHSGIVNQSLIGSSGVVSGIMGVAWGLNPRNPVRCVIGYWLVVLIGFLPFRISVRWLIIIYVAQDLLRLWLGHQGAAYEVHLSGVLAGWIMGVGLHWLRQLTSPSR